MKTIRMLAFTAATFAYAVIVLGFVVRITGSGMGCGDDWPLCNGRIIPPLNDFATVVEYGHRLAVLGLSAFTFAVFGSALLRRGDLGAGGPGGTMRPALLAVGLLVTQSLVGALAVKLQLPPWTVIVHLGLAMALLASLIVLGLRAGVQAGVTHAPVRTTLQIQRSLTAAAVLGASAVLFGGLTANLGAAPACQGFPLCSGQLWPTAAESGLPHIHWTHRLLAYALFLHLLGTAVNLTRRGAASRLQAAVWITFGIALLQVVVGAVMVLTALPSAWRGLHAVVGTAVWIGLVYLVWLGWQPRQVTVAQAHPGLVGT